MITTWKELCFYLKAYDIMNEQVFPQSWWRRMLFPSPIRRYLRSMRKMSYCHYKAQSNNLYYLLYTYYKWKNHRLGCLTGFDIPMNALGYGIRIGHHGSIVMNGSTHIGNYCRLENLTTFADGEPKYIGNHVHIATSVVVAKAVTVADGCTISACSFLNSSILDNNVLWGGYLLDL